MPCCRGREKDFSDGSPDCKTLVSGGAGTRLWPISTDKGVQLTVRTLRNGFVELGTFLATYRCTSSAAKMLSRHLGTIRTAALQHPAAFLSYRKNGVSLVELLRLSEKLTKKGRPNVQPTVSAHPPS